MEILFAPLLFIVLLFIGPFVALNAYLLAWICGPAIRHTGKCWEEGRLIAFEQGQGFYKTREPLEPRGHFETFVPPSVARPYEPPHAVQAPAADDAGHRWLGGTEGKKA